MRRTLSTLTLLACTLPMTAAAIDTRRLSVVEENHARIEHAGRRYVLDSYIVLFQRPYYVLVREDDGRAMTLEQAEAVAVAYIAPRGCTTPIERRRDLDRASDDRTEWLLGIEC